MITNKFNRLKFTATILFALPALVYAAPPATAPYYTDASQSYVQDQVSKDMEELNGFLCMLGAMAPDQLVNKGTYIAMVDQNKCKPHGQNQNNVSGGLNTQQSNYLAVELSATRESNSTPMKTKIWLDNIIDSNGAWDCSSGTTCVKPTYKVPMYVTASQAPSKAAPYGVFRLDYCKQYASDLNCNKHLGYIDASKTGLSFYTIDYKKDYTNKEYYDEFELALSASSSSNSGSGIVIKTSSITGTPVPSAIVFAHNPDFFYRDDGINTPQCFDRSEGKSLESVYRYGLYDITTGERFEHLSGFPFKYVSANTNTYYGYIGYYGYWLPDEANLKTGDTVSKISYDTFPPSETSYIFNKAGGKMTKYTTSIFHLSDIDKVLFQYTPYKTDIYVANFSSAPVASGTDTFNPYPNLTRAMIHYESYQIYWDKDYQWYDYYQSNALVTGTFLVKKHYNNTTYQWDTLTNPIPIHPGWFAYSAPNGLFAYAAFFGGYFNIAPSDVWNFWNWPTCPYYPTGVGCHPNSLKIITNNEDVVYPADMLTINSKGGLKCIGDCPTKASIAAFNADPVNVSPFQNTEVDHNSPYSGFTTLYNYTMNPATYNLVNASNDVIQTQANYIYYQSGRMVTADDMALVTTNITADSATYTARGCTNVNGSGCTFYQSDVDRLGATKSSYTYYKWTTNSNSYDQLAFLTSGTTPVLFYPALPVKFSIPNTTRYGDKAGSTELLYYGDFGNLGGINYKCIDLRNNADCVYYDPSVPTWDPTLSPTGLITPYDKQYYAAEYSIPFDLTDGFVTAAIDQGTITKGTKFLVKSLDKELRLNRVPIGVCTVQGLGQNISIGSLPSSTKWNDPSAIIGDKPVLNPVPAPRVIHGAVQY